ELDPAVLPVDPPNGDPGAASRAAHVDDREPLERVLGARLPVLADPDELRRQDLHAVDLEVVVIARATEGVLPLQDAAELLTRIDVDLEVVVHDAAATEVVVAGVTCRPEGRLVVAVGVVPRSRVERHPGLYGRAHRLGDRPILEEGLVVE